MAEQKGRQPDYVNREQGAAAWVNLDKNGKKYLAVQILGGQLKFNLFTNEPKDKSASELIQQKIEEKMEA